MSMFANRKLEAFSLAEVLITLGVIGVLAAMVMPMTKNVLPDKFETLHRKGSYAIEHAVSYVVNNEDYYDAVNIPDGSGRMKLRHGLANTYKINIDGNEYGSDTAGSAAAQEKFCRLLASRFNIRGDVNCNASTFNSPTFTSIDGIQWLLPKSSFSDHNKHEIIAFKTSTTSDRRPSNCGYMPAAKYNEIFSRMCGDSCTRTNSAVKSKITTNQSSCKKPDIFVYAIKSNGTLVKAEALTDKIKTNK